MEQSKRLRDVVAIEIGLESFINSELFFESFDEPKCFGDYSLLKSTIEFLNGFIKEIIKIVLAGS